ncbi:HD domain-containing protein [Leptotrichia trevisanii]|uniref:HD domain protein n=1 Tax=Leptotrichia trevisanii TaxID=109328 RepID=A0A510K031_9FUSO|nr:HD domain-containing protein [Leptotrichia trevisanii]BBM44989.1 HD domain protein [Leptotrichia trevisanii]
MYKNNDELYGEYYVDDVIYEIINTKIFKRLKNIYQSGGGYLVNDLWNVNRQEHSIGTMILSLKFGGNIEEQIRALLHDISHTAFSHVIDYILKNENEDYHEKIQKNFLNDEELVSILRKYNLNIKRIMLKNYSFLDNELPELSFDRIDYTLRDLFRQKRISHKDVREIVNNLAVYQNKLCFNSLEIGKWFQKLYFQEVVEYFQDPLNMYINTMLSNLLASALNEKIIQLQDFNFTDECIIKKINSSSKKKELEDIINKKKFDEFLLLEEKIKVKKRYIDPYILVNNEIKRISEIK